jgi:hypothetical protein
MAAPAAERWVFYDGIPEPTVDQTHVRLASNGLRPVSVTSAFVSCLGLWMRR